MYLSRATQTMVSDDMKAAMQGKVLIKLKYFHVELIRREAAVWPAAEPGVRERPGTSESVEDSDRYGGGLEIMLTTGYTQVIGYQQEVWEGQIEDKNVPEKDCQYRVSREPSQLSLLFLTKTKQKSFQVLRNCPVRKTVVRHLK